MVAHRLNATEQDSSSLYLLVSECFFCPFEYTMPENWCITLLPYFFPFLTVKRFRFYVAHIIVLEYLVFTTNCDMHR